MKSWKTPTPEQVKRAIRLMPKREQQVHFLDKLENPLWVEPLQEEGFFKNPPAPQPREDGTVTLLLWPESRYLARMASHEPETVAKIILNMRETKNPRVQEDFLDAALAMPASIAARMVPHATRWLKSPYQLLLPDKLAQLVQKLAKEGENQAALKSADALLELTHEKRGRVELDDGSCWDLGTKVQPRLEEWQYEQILRRVMPPLLDRDPRGALKLLCDKLEEAIGLECAGESLEAGEDYSYIWRPAIEPHNQNLGMESKDYLVDFIRDGSVKAVAQGGKLAADVLNALHARKYKVFIRILLHVLREVPGADPLKVEVLLKDREMLSDLTVWHEFHLLLKQEFQNLTSGAQSAILRNIEQGPAQIHGDSEEDRQRGIRIWQLEHLTPIAEFLSDEWAEKHRSLVAELGEPEHPEFPVGRGGSWVGPTSPRTAEQLEQMNDEELTTFLRSWRPSDDWRSPTPRGLERTLGEVVLRNPQRSATLANDFQMDIDPTYIGGLLSGLSRACKDGKQFDWEPAVRLCAYVSHQDTRYRPLHADPFHADQDWGPSRQEAARLLAQGLQSGAAEIPFKLRSDVWNGLEPLAEDPDPTPDHEQKYGGENMSPHQLAINTVRGCAVQAVILYALWCLRNLHPEEKDGRQRAILSELPEVRRLLERHLAPEFEPSAAVKSTYGRFLPWLVLLDREWVREWLPKIFPDAADLAHLRQAVWDTYVIFCEPYDGMLELLSEEYRVAVKRLGEEHSRQRHAQDVQIRLGQHLVTFYLRGEISLTDKDSILREYFALAPAETRARVVRSFGVNLKRMTQVTSKRIIERLRALWEFRLESVERSSDTGSCQEEFIEFGDWFASGAFDEGWSLKALERTLGKTGGWIIDGKAVCQRLGALASTHPRMVMTVVRPMLRAGAERRVIQWWCDHLKLMLKAVLSSSDEQARVEAREAINALGAMGIHQFRDLLKQE